MYIVLRSFVWISETNIDVAWTDCQSLNYKYQETWMSSRLSIIELQVSVYLDKFKTVNHWTTSIGRPDKFKTVNHWTTSIRRPGWVQDCQPLNYKYQETWMSSRLSITELQVSGDLISSRLSITELQVSGDLDEFKTVNHWTISISRPG